MNRVDAWRMIQRRAADLGMRIKVGCHTFRATGITVYLEAGGTLENAIKQWPRTKAREPPSSTIAPATKSPSMKSKELQFDVLMRRIAASGSESQLGGHEACLIGAVTVGRP
jgi:hypothetical protein